MFNFYLKNKAGVDGWTLYYAASWLQHWFNRCCRGTPFQQSDFRWLFSASVVEDHELVVYILPSQFNSIIRRKSPSFPLEAGGATFRSSGGMISEVYMDHVEGDSHVTKLLAALIFHEFMHNKLDANPNNATIGDVHTQGGGGLAVGNISSKLDLTFRNEQLMRQVLSKKEKQYTGSV